MIRIDTPNWQKELDAPFSIEGFELIDDSRMEEVDRLNDEEDLSYDNE